LKTRFLVSGHHEFVRPRQTAVRLLVDAIEFVPLGFGSFTAAHAHVSALAGARRSRGTSNLAPRRTGMFPSAGDSITPKELMSGLRPSDSEAVGNFWGLSLRNQSRPHRWQDTCMLEVY
jgi:hypothetical protein